MIPQRSFQRSCFALTLFLLTFAPCAFGGRVVATAPSQPFGALSGRIVYTSGGHGWTFNNSAGVWYTQRGDNNEVIEDYGNLDQMNLFAAYCFNAGATVVAFRPLGYQTNEVVLDNTSPNVQFSGQWEQSAALNNFYGRAGDVPYRFATLDVTETARATYTPTFPKAGFYPVYTWVAHGGNRTFQLYRILHTGGEGQVRVPHHMVGHGWVYLGTYYFNAGSNALTGSVVISNLEPLPRVGAVVIADAIRFGNGMGDVVPTGTNPRVSGYPREEECARYWVQRMLGVGGPTSVYDSGSNDGDDNVGAPPRMAREMNRAEAGNMYHRVFVSFHSNAGGGNARGCEGLYNNADLFPGTATSNQFRLAELLATELNNDLAAPQSPPLEVPWFVRPNPTYARTDFAFGEINNNSINNEFDATILEVAYHDNPDDARLLRDPRVRTLMARASYQGVVRYFNEFAQNPAAFLPEPPGNIRARVTGSGITVSWSPPGTGGGLPTGFVVYRSRDGYGFGQPSGVAGGAATFVTFTNLAPDVPWYFRVSATNSGGESMPSETVACRRSSRGDAPILLVNGYDRYDRTIAPRQTAGPGIGGAAGGVATFDRVQPRLINSFDYLVQHAEAVSRCGVPFDSCQNEAVASGLIGLASYRGVLWASGQESTADESFNTTEQARLSSYLAQGGRLFVSGSEIAWDLDRSTGPASSDRAFLHDQLHAALATDLDDDAGTTTFLAESAGIFAGNAAGNFDDAAGAPYVVGFPDVLTPAGAGATAALRYSGGRTGAAAVQHRDDQRGSRVVYWGFPFETVASAALREASMFDVLSFFEVIPPPILVTPVFLGAGGLQLTWTTIPGRRYRLQFKNRLDEPFWVNLGLVLTANAETLSQVDNSGTVPTGRFYRVVMVE